MANGYYVRTDELAEDKLSEFREGNAIFGWHFFKDNTAYFDDRATAKAYAGFTSCPLHVVKDAKFGSTDTLASYEAWHAD